jgi:hypothetical protein
MMRWHPLLLVLFGVAVAAPALAEAPDDPAATPPVVVLRGSSAPPTPWYTPPPRPREVEVREVTYYVPTYYYLALPYRIARHHHGAVAPTAHRK